MLDLRKYVPEGRVSTGLLAWYEERLVWAIGQSKYWQDDQERTTLPLIGIGGGQEKDETLPETVQREAQEEARAGVRLVGARQTLWIDADGQARLKDLSGELAEGEPAPLLIWKRRVTLRDDKGNPIERDYINPVYEGDFQLLPQPGDDTPGLLLMTDEQLLSLLEGPRPFRELLDEGVEYLGQALPADTWLQLQGSAEFLARYWDRLSACRGE